MTILRFRNNEDSDIMRKLKKIKQTISEIEECLDQASDISYRDSDYEHSRYNYDRRY